MLQNDPTLAIVAVDTFGLPASQPENNPPKIAVILDGFSVHPLGGKPTSIADWQKRRREVDRVHGYMVSQNLPELIENSYYERYEIFQLGARCKCLCTLSSTAYGIDGNLCREFM